MLIKLQIMLMTMFQSALGAVDVNDIWKSLTLMLEGMVGIFVVMVLIFLVIVILTKVTGKKSDDDKKE